MKAKSKNKEALTPSKHDPKNTAVYMMKMIAMIDKSLMEHGMRVMVEDGVAIGADDGYVKATLTIRKLP